MFKKLCCMQTHSRCGKILQSLQSIIIFRLPWRGVPKSTTHHNPLQAHRLAPQIHYMSFKKGDLHNDMHLICFTQCEIFTKIQCPTLEGYMHSYLLCFLQFDLCISSCVLCFFHDINYNLFLVQPLDDISLNIQTVVSFFKWRSTE